MSRDFYESTTGSPAAADNKFLALGNIETWVYPRGIATTANFRTLGAQVASIFQRSTGVAAGPSPESGATGGPNPFTTSLLGSIQFWAERGKYDIFVHDLTVPARIADRLIPWEASPSDDVRLASLNAEIVNLFCPISGCLSYGGSVDPPGGIFLLADGRLVDKTTYAAYFALVGHKYNGGVDPGSNKVRIQDKRGRVTVGADNMGTTQGAANRLPNSNRVAGQNGGEERHTLTIAELAAHNHNGATGTGSTGAGNSGNDSPDHSHSVSSAGGPPFGAVAAGFDFNVVLGGVMAAYGTGGASARHAHTVPALSVPALSIASQGSGTPHNVMQPYECDNFIVRMI